MTMYNEPETALLSSLAGIKHNLEHLVMSSNRTLAEQITLCIIIDGREKMSPSAAIMLETLAIYEPKQLALGADLHIFDSRLNLELLEKLLYSYLINQHTDNSWLNVYQTALQEYEPFLSQSHQPISLRVLLCIKEANAGKINSHWWFFQSVLYSATT